MRHNPQTQLAGWAALLTGVLLILSSCGDDSSPVPFTADTTDQDQDSLDPTSDTGSEQTSEDTTPSGVDRSGELIGRFEIVNYSLADGAGLTNIVGTVAPFVEFMADGTLAFQTGCNSGTAMWQTSGTYYDSSLGFLDDTPDGQSISITEVSKEEATCDGFLGEQDVDLVDNFLATERFWIDSEDGGIGLSDEFVLVITEPAS